MSCRKYRHGKRDNARGSGDVGNEYFVFRSCYGLAVSARTGRSCWSFDNIEAFRRLSYKARQFPNMRDFDTRKI